MPEGDKEPSEGGSEDWEDAARPPTDVAAREVAALKLQRCFRGHFVRERQSLGKRDSFKLRKKQAVLAAIPERPRLPDSWLAELRFLAHKPAGDRPGDGRPPDETCRMLRLLLHLPAFAEVLALLPPRARLCAVQSLSAARVEPQDLVVRESELPGSARRTAGPSSFQDLVALSAATTSCGPSSADGPDEGGSEGGSSVSDEEDVLCVLLCGESALYMVSQELLTRMELLPLGSEVGVHTVDPARLPSGMRGKCTLEARAVHGVEVLRLPLSALVRAAAEEHEREGLRAATRAVLRSTSPCCREREDLATVRRHLGANVACFQGLPEDALDVICQQSELRTFARGACLCRAGDTPDGLRVVLRGYASARQAGSAAAVASSKDGTGSAEVVLGSLSSLLFTEFWEDCSVDEWLLCMAKEDRHIFNVVAIEDCEVLYVSKALYLRYMRSSRAVQCLSHMALSTLVANAEASHDHAVSTVFLSKASRGSTALEANAAKAVEEENKWWAQFAQLRFAASGAVDGMLGSAGDVGLPLLCLFSRRVRRQLCSHAKLWRASHGEVLFREGDPSDSLVVVLRGDVGLFQKRSSPTTAQERRRPASAEDGDLLRRLPSEFFGSLIHLVDRCLWRHGLPRDHLGVRWLRSLDTYLESERPADPSAPKLGKAKIRAYRQLAESLLDTLARRWKALQAPLRGTVPSPLAERLSLYSHALAKQLLGRRTLEVLEEAGDDDAYLDIYEIGDLVGFVGAGSPLCAAAVGAPGGGPTRAHTAVALGHNTELLVLEHAAVAEVLHNLSVGLPDGDLVAEILRERAGPDRTPQDLRTLDGLVRRHQAFAELENLGRTGICRSMELYEVPEGAYVCRQGEKADAFFQVLRGRIRAYAREKGEAEGGAEPAGQHGAEGEEGADDGTLVLCMGTGGAFGERAMLGELPTQPLTIKAEEATTLVRVWQRDYERSGSDWRGEQAARRRALDSLLGKPSAVARAQRDSEPLVRIMHGVPFIRKLEPQKCREVVRHAVHVQVPAGVRVQAALRDAGLEERAERPPRSLPLCFVLAGCVGRYAPGTEEAPEEDEEEEPGSPSSPRASDHRSSAQDAESARGRRGSREDALALRRDLAQFQRGADQLSKRLASQPLHTSLQDHLHLHYLNHNIRLLKAQMGDMPPLEPPIPEDGECNFVSEATSIGRGGSYSLVERTVSMRSVRDSSTSDLAHPRGQPWRDSSKSSGADDGLAGIAASASVAAAPPQGAVPMTPHGSHPDLHAVSFPSEQAESNSTHETSRLSFIADCKGELLEGDVFGGWADSVARGGSAQRTEMPEAADFRAHVDTDLLVLTSSAYEKALATYEDGELAWRVELLQRCLPSEMPTECIERLAPLFDVEVRPKGSVLLREGCQSSAFWLIVEGHCCCSASPGAFTGGGGGGGGGVPSAAYDSAGAPENDGGAGSTLGEQAAAAPGSGATGNLVRGSTPQETGAGQDSTTPAQPTLGQGSGAVVRGDRSAPASLGILREGEFVGLSSALLQIPEPFAVTVSSPQAKLLVMRAEHSSRFSYPALEALRGVARARYDWYTVRSEQIAKVPGQSKLRLEQVRAEAQQAQLPRVIDSPFLRRQGQRSQGLATLDMVCAHFGGEVHPESDWVLAPQSRGLFQGMRLMGGAQEPCSPAGAPSPGGGASSGGAAPPGNSTVAVQMFNTFHRLGRQLREEVPHRAPGQGPSSSSSELQPPSPSSASAAAASVQEAPLGERLGVPFPVRPVPRPSSAAEQPQARDPQQVLPSLAAEPCVQVKVQSRVYRMAGTDLNVWPARLDKLYGEAASSPRSAAASLASQPRPPGGSGAAGSQSFKSKAMQHRHIASTEGAAASGAASEAPSSDASASKRRGRRGLRKLETSEGTPPPPPREPAPREPAPRIDDRLHAHAQSESPRQLGSLKHTPRRLRSATTDQPMSADAAMAAGGLGRLRREHSPGELGHQGFESAFGPGRLRSARWCDAPRSARNPRLLELRGSVQRRQGSEEVVVAPPAPRRFIR